MGSVLELLHDLTKITTTITKTMTTPTTKRIVSDVVKLVVHGADPVRLNETPSYFIVESENETLTIEVEPTAFL